ncbi:patatin-like protein [Frankia sp. AgB32]|uniref:patatin-like protein n=1 Tax=Frankia sp. AgB32 TaxID=631119 RepID=UPI0024B15B47|nr:patatin-like protein [Frankia sp. AgB32]MCK9894353.1 patatin-like protein [Frankia sp. AgB32]
MRDEATQEVRLAVVMTGGASLAVWMGGVATEINLAAGARDDPSAGGPADPTDAAVAARYARLLAILDVEIAVDVLAGTSAGGINAAMLGFASARRADLSPLRDLWLSLGSLDAMMRTPDDRTFPSLLRGDAVVLPALHTALAAVAATAPPQHRHATRPTSMFVTTTIQRGEVVEHTDSLGGTMYDVDYRGLFVFGTPDLVDPGAIPRLALAARASSAFPGAFEPAYVPVGHPVDDAHPDMAAYVNSGRSFHASDGGILVNRPIGPALAAIFDRPAERQVRRVLTYVVPSARPAQLLPQQPTPSPPKAGSPDPLPAPPSVTATLLGALDAALNQSIGTDLAALRAHNDAVRGTRTARRRLLRLAPAGTARLADDAVYRAYRRIMAEQVATPVVEALLRVLTDRADLPRPPDADVIRGDAAGRVGITNAATAAALATLPDHLPGAADLGELWKLGQPALDAVKGVLISMINEGYVLCAVPAARARLARLLAAVHSAAGPAGAPDSASLYTSSPRPGVFTTVTATLASMPGAPTLDVAAEATRRWLRVDPAGGHGSQRLADAWSALRDAAVDVRAELAALLRDGNPPAGSPIGPGLVQPVGLSVRQRRELAARVLTDFVAYLPTSGDQAVIALLDLHLVERESGGAAPDQPVELVQLSADLPTALDPRRRLAEDKLTGLALGNFAAFAKSSWRANDWMWGRLDGAGWLVRILLDPRRLVLRRDLAVSPDALAEPTTSGPVDQADADRSDERAFARRGWLSGLVSDLAEVAGTPAPQEVLAELDFLTDPDAPVPPSLPQSATWVAAGLQRDIAGKELVELARAVRADNASGLDPRPTAGFLTAVERALAAPPTATTISISGTGTGTGTAPPAEPLSTGKKPAGTLPRAAVDEVMRACEVPGERITDPAQGPILVTSLAQIVAVATAWAASSRFLPRPAWPAAFLARVAARVGFELVRDVAHRRRRVMIAFGAALVGLGIAGGLIFSGALGALGIALGLLGLLVLGVPSWRRLPGGLAVAAAGLLVVIAAAGVIPVLHDRLFDWLRDDVVPYLDRHPWAWATVFALLVAPGVWSLAEAVTTRRARRRG